jgi:hypothetical protein
MTPEPPRHGAPHRQFHRETLAEATRMLPVGGRFVLHCKDHKRDGKRQHVTD